MNHPLRTESLQMEVAFDHSFRNDGTPSFKQTESFRNAPVTNYKNPRFAGSTGLSESAIAKMYSVKSASLDAPIHQPMPSPKVDGVVIEVIEEVSIRCELFLPEDRKVEVILPRALFPDDISFGTPITLELIEDRGIRQPRILLRQPNPEKLSAVRERIAQMINQL